VIAATGFLLGSRKPEKSFDAEVRVAPAAAVKSGNSFTAELMNAKDGLTYVLIPAGSFTMGCDKGTCRPDTYPAHDVTITKPFYLSKTEVPFEAYDKFAGISSGEGQNPVANVSWDDAREYCEWAGGRLPSEAEWEHAARGAQVDSRLSESAWYKGNSGGKVHAAGKKEPNAAGVHDMQGNVWEWVSDWYGPFYYRASPALDPPGPSRGSERVLRGGSALSEEDPARVFARCALPPGMKDSTIGFRCVLDQPAP
jgi:formylglycine-generating enzyme required for sulfatase activity